MICPKCGVEQPAENPECKRCGVIFAKLTPEDFQAGLPEIQTKEMEQLPAPGSANTLQDYLLGSTREENPFFWAGRFIVYLIIFIWGWKFITTPLADAYFAQTFLHGVNLVFHEAGHVIFGLFGGFIGVLGGTLGQVLMPLVCFAAFLYYRNPFAATVALWWTGESMLDVAPYINDARALQLPLLGGNIGADNPDFHDWLHLLQDLSWLSSDHKLALLTNHLGCLLVLVSLVWGGYLLRRQYLTIHLNKIARGN